MAQHSNEKLQRVLQTIAHQEGNNFTFDADKIASDAHFGSSLYTNLPIKLLSIFGGFLATLFFMGFLFATGLYNSNAAMLVFGVAFLVGSEVLHRLRHDLLLSSVSVTTNITGYFLLGMSVSELTNDITLALILEAVAAVFIVVSEGSVLVFLAVLVLGGSLMSLPYIFKIPDLMHVLVGLVAAILTYMSLHEAKLITINRKLNKLYGPLRMGLVFVLTGSIILLSHQNFDTDRLNYTWISTILLVAALLVMLHRIMLANHVTSKQTQLIVYACCVVILAPTFYTPSIAGSLLIVLSSFYIGHRVSFIVGLLALGYFIILYYYNLAFTLLQKSGILILTGCLFLGGLYLLNRYLRSHAN